MVNIEDFIKRLEKLLDYYTLTASSFADKIGVQRSSLSHLLSGRNKPSLDFILKILEVFPEVDLYWLLKGQGDFPKGNGSENPQEPIAENKTVAPDLFSSKSTENPDFKANDIPAVKTSCGNIERIVVFYDNGLFKEYKPE